MIHIVNKRNYKGDGVYCGRPSPLGNPYSHVPSALAAFRVASRDEAVERYREWLPVQLRGNNDVSRAFYELVRFYKDFGELTLICWCAPQRCHAEILRDLIEEYALRKV